MTLKTGHSQNYRKKAKTPPSLRNTLPWVNFNRRMSPKSLSVLILHGWLVVMHESWHSMWWLLVREREGKEATEKKSVLILQCCGWSLWQWIERISEDFHSWSWILGELIWNSLSLSYSIWEIGLIIMAPTF